MHDSSQELQHSISFQGLNMRVEDVERSLAFYMKIPGAEIITHHEGVFALVRLGAGRLGLLQMPSAPPFHLEFETPADLDALAQQFQAAGMDSVKKPALKSWGEVNFTVRDPDGNLLEFETTDGVKAWEE